MKKQILPLLLLLPLVTLSGCSQTNPDVNIGKPEVDYSAKEMFSEIKLGYNIGNTLDAHPGFNNYKFNPQGVGTENLWGNPTITKEYVHYIKECGFDSIRLPVTWYPHVDSNWKIEDAWMNRVKEVVDYCVDEELPVILNLHHDTGVDGWRVPATRQDSQCLAIKEFMIQSHDMMFYMFYRYFPRTRSGRSAQRAGTTVPGGAKGAFCSRFARKKSHHRAATRSPGASPVVSTTIPPIPGMPSRKPL